MYPNLISLANNKYALYEHFKLTAKELNHIDSIKSSSNRLCYAILLKSTIFLGYVPQKKEDIPDTIINYIAEQLELKAELNKKIEWKNATWYRNAKNVKTYIGLRPFSNNIMVKLFNISLNNYASGYTKNKNMTFCIEKCNRELIELPPEKVLRRINNSAYRKFFDQLYKKTQKQLGSKTIRLLDLCIYSDNKESSFNSLKSLPGKPGVETLLKEIKKLNYIRSFEINKKIYRTMNKGLVKEFSRRIKGDDLNRLKNRISKRRHTQLGAYLYMLESTVTDDIVKIFLEMIRKIEKRADTIIEKSLKKHVKKLYNKNAILYKTAKAIINNPEGIIQEVIFPKVSLETFKELLSEHNNDTLCEYEEYRSTMMKTRYIGHYRKILCPILETLSFKTNNPLHEPLIRALEIVKKYAGKSLRFYPEKEVVPDELLTPRWKDIIFTKDKVRKRVIKHYFELCVLDKLEKAIKCKEVWIEGAKEFGNPDVDLPQNWSECRLQYYDRHNIPEECKDLIDTIKEKMASSLRSADNYFSKKSDVYVYQHRNRENGYFRVPAIEKRDERPVLAEIKQKVLNRWGIHKLIDIVVEADRMVNFSRYFSTSGTRQILGPDEVRERLIYCLFQLGTNLELKNISASCNPNCSYQDLYYFRRRYIQVESLRECVRGLTNKIFEIRSKDVWGNTTACASDGKQFGSWDQNLMAASNPHYMNTGIMAYWHVDNNNTCIYSQLKNCNSSEKAAMIEGLIKHNTQMKIESNYVDSAGQSEIVFGICHFLGIDLLPRLKRIKYQRLCLPDKELANKLPNLKSVFDRPIRWGLIAEQYDEMVKHVVAMIEGIAKPEAILRRFLSYNRIHPTYKAFIELGKAKKTIFLCRYLTDKTLRVEINSGLNIIENWNSVNSFIHYGRKTEFQTNDPTMQEMSLLCLHLLQNAVILVNTMMIDKVIKEDGFFKQMTDDDFNSLTPLFTQNINPYGTFLLDLNKEPILEVA